MEAGSFASLLNSSNSEFEFDEFIELIYLLTYYNSITEEKRKSLKIIVLYIYNM